MPQARTNSIDWTDLYADLSRPFPDVLIKFRVGAISRDKTKAQALPYVDPRSYEDRLNELVPGAWSVEFDPWGANRIVCRLTIHGITRSSTGDGIGSPDGICGMAAESQAFRRTCSKFGLGRYLYELQPQWVSYDAHSKRMETTPSPQRSNTRHPPIRAAAAIGRKRASDMHRELARIGLGRSEQETFASKALGRPVARLADVTDVEARQVWEAATKKYRAGSRSPLKSPHRNQTTQGGSASTFVALPGQR